MEDCPTKLSDKRKDFFLSWDGISFCPHTVNHANLTTESLETANEEIVTSGKIIEDKTGKKAKHFCYPNGRWNNNIRNIAKGSYSSACTTRSGFVSNNSDIYALNRIGINEEMATGWNDNFSKYMFTFSIFIESLK